MNPKVHFVLLLFLLKCFCTDAVYAQTSYYHDGQNSVHAFSSWWSSPNLSGIHPSGFSAGDTFVVQHGLSISTTQPWSFSGVGTVLLLERGSRLTLGESLSMGGGTTLCIADSASLEADTFSVSGAGALQLRGGSLILAKTETMLPELSGAYTIDSGRICISSAGNAIIRGSRTYDTLEFTGPFGIKTFSSAISGTNSLGVLKLSGTDTVNLENRSIGGSATSLIQSGGVLQLGGTGTKPDISGSFDISGGCIEYQGNALSQQTIRNGIPFKHLKISGTSVGTSSGNINLADSALFELSEGAVWTMSNSNVGISSGQASFFQLDGKFILHHEAGLLGGTQTAIRLHPDSVVFGPNAKVVYQRAGNQTISNVAYRNLELNGSGIKSGTNVYVVDTLQISGSTSFSGNIQSLNHLLYTQLQDSVVQVGDEWADTTNASIHLQLFSTQKLLLDSSKVVNGILHLDSGILAVSNVRISLDSVNTHSGSLMPLGEPVLYFSGNHSVDQLAFTYDTAFWSSITFAKNTLATVSLKDSLKVAGKVELLGGTLQCEGKLILKCTSSGCAQLLKNGGDLQGNLSMELIVPSSGWAYLGAPIQASLSQWNGKVTMQYSGSGQNIFRWDATQGTWSSDVDSASNFGQGNAYAFRFSPTDSGKVLQFSGLLNNPVQYSAGRLAYGFPIDSSSFSDSTVVDGWNLLANPFTASLDWGIVRNGMGGQLNQFHYLYRNSSESYLAHNGQLGNAQLNGKIRPFQAFFVKLGAASDTVSSAFDFDSSMLCLEQGQTLFKNQPNQVTIYLLNGEDTLGNILVWQSEEASIKPNKISDALLPAGSQQLFWKAQGIEWSVLSKRSLVEPVDFQVRAKNLVGGRLLVDHAWGTDTLMLILGEDSVLVFPEQRLIVPCSLQSFRLLRYHTPFKPDNHLSTTGADAEAKGICQYCIGKEARLYSLEGRLIKVIPNFSGASAIPKGSYFILQCGESQSKQSRIVYQP
ncbi:MAG: hypothetical protein EP332_13715 [Bacteroidetes bacterium]|nr:MAG: hypothetical protein EP332_13715 [Bacteroidota bacterium]